MAKKYNGTPVPGPGPGRINYSKMSKREIVKLLDKGSMLLNEWTDAVVTMGAELFIICPQHEIFQSNYFADNTKLMMFNKALELLPVCKYKRIIYEDDTLNAQEIDPDNIIKIVETYRNKMS